MSLKVYDLQCRHGHVFEAWFQNGDAFGEQASQGLLSCPVCGDGHIERRLSAPRLNLAGAAPPPSEQPRDSARPDAQQALSGLQAEIWRELRELVRRTENVGPRFAEEARKMHREEIGHRPIRGSASPQEQRELAQEGIEVMALPAFLDDEQLQ